MFEIFMYAAAIVAVLWSFGEMENRRYSQLSLFDELFNQPDPPVSDAPLDFDPNLITCLSQLWQRPISTDAIVPFRRSLKRLGIRQLRLIARDRGLKRYSQFTKPQLLEYLQA